MDSPQLSHAELLSLLETELRELLDSGTLTEDQKQALFRELLAVVFPKEP